MGDDLWVHARVVPICYANGYWGYVPSRRAGKDDYEAICSAFDARAERAIRKVLSSAAAPMLAG